MNDMTDNSTPRSAPSTDERAAFEAWYAPSFARGERANMMPINRNGEYRQATIEIAWRAWRAAWKAARASTSEDARDAARYRWLRDRADGAEGCPFVCVLTDGYTGQLDGDAADDAIDAALNKRNGG